MGTTKGTVLVGLGACVVLAAGLFVYLGQLSSPSPTPSSDATSSPSSTSSPIATGRPAPTATIGSITWQGGGPLNLGAGGEGQLVIPFGDRLLAFGNVGAGVADALGGKSAAVWSSSDAVTWKQITKPTTFTADSAYPRAVTADGRGGLYMIASRYGSARSNALWHSPDGVSWTRMTVGKSQILTSATIASANGTAVVTGQALEQQQYRRYVWYSTDALTWTEAALPDAYPDPDTSASIVGGVNGFEIVEESGAGLAWHSNDGRTWVKVEPPGANQPGTFAPFVPTHLLVSDGTFVAMGFDGGNAGVPAAWTSEDGIAWSRSTIEDPSPAFGCAAGCQPKAVTKVANALVAVGYRTQERTTLPASAPIVTWVSSDDGRTWRVRGAGSPGILPSVLAPIDSDVVMFGEQLPVGTQFPDGALLRAARGTIAWQAGESPTPAQPSIRPTPSATPSPGPPVMTGPIEFRQATVPNSPVEPWSNSVAYVNGHFYSVFDRWTVSGTPRRGPLVWESDDGVAWRQIAKETRFNGKGKQDCAFIAALTEDGAGGLVAVGSMDGSCAGAVNGTAAAWQSDDGVTWRRATIQPSLTGVLWHVAYAAGNLVAIGEDGQELYSTDRGKTWQPGSLNGLGGLLTVAPWQDGFIAGDGGHDWSSSDGQTWVSLGPAPQGASAVGAVFVGVSSRIYWSSDGASWTAAVGPPDGSVDPRVIGSDGEIAIAVDVQNEMWITTDGKTWHDTGTKLIVSTSELHGVVPVFCIGAGRLVTIVTDGHLTRAYYADVRK
jgi:hypothetical protein